jgi:hypothetical protein
MSNGYNLRDRQNINQPERYRQDLQRNNSLAANPLQYASTNTYIPSNVFGNSNPPSRNNSNNSAMSGLDFSRARSFGGKTIRAANTKKYRALSKKNKSRRHKKTRSKRRPGCLRGAWYCK